MQGVDHKLLLAAAIGGRILITQHPTLVYVDVGNFRATYCLLVAKIMSLLPLE